MSTESLKSAFALFAIDLDDEDHEILAKMREVCGERGWDEESLAEAWVTHWKSDEHRNNLSTRGLELLSKAMEGKSSHPTAVVEERRLDTASYEPAEDSDGLLSLYGGAITTAHPEPKRPPRQLAISRPADFSPLPGSPASASYAGRGNVGAVVGEFGAREGARWEGDGTVVDIRPSAHFQPAPNRPFMFQKVPEIAQVLSERVEVETDRLITANEVGEDDLANVCQPTQEWSVIAGSVVALDASGKLGGEGGLGLEGSLSLSNGRTVPVDTRLLPEFSFFPGQVPHQLTCARELDGRLKDKSCII